MPQHTPQNVTFKIDLIIQYYYATPGEKTPAPTPRFLAMSKNDRQPK